MSVLSDQRRAASITDYVFYLVGVAGLAFSITGVWLGMRAVMNIGGFCASGGAYEISVECPAGIDVIMILAFPLGFLAAGLMVWAGTRIGGAYAGLVGLAWPALFLSLGWNFLEYAVRPPDGSGEIIWGWLIPGVIFVIMGGAPLLGFFQTRGDHTTILPGFGAQATPRDVAQLRRALRESSRMATSDSRYAPASATSRADVPAGSESLIDKLERLAALKESGALSDVEFEQAKRSLLAEGA